MPSRGSGAIALAAALSVGALCAPPVAATGPEIPIATLMAQRSDLAGFGPARMSRPFSSSYAAEWAFTFAPNADSAKREATELTEMGFREGAFVYFTGRRERAHEHREAVSSALVFATSAGAEQDLAISVATELREHDHGHLHRSTIHAIPGSSELGEGGRHGGVDNVLFTTGRCFFVIGDAIPRSSSAGQVRRPVRSAAIAVYDRAKQPCAEASVSSTQ
jgi:hypothetical protein